MKNLIFVFLIATVACQSEKKSQHDKINVDWTINVGGPTKPLQHFWASTGYTPAEMALVPSMQFKLDNLAAVNQHGIRYIRPHYLLNLVGSKNIGTPNVVYNWAKLDSVLDQFTTRGLKPIFEVMGYPSSTWTAQSALYDPAYQGQEQLNKVYFNDFTNDKKLHSYKDFIKKLIEHLLDRYGKDEIHSWYFEGTNEPDIQHFWPFGIPGYLNYYDACSATFREVNPSIHFGGPGTAHGVSEMFKAVLAHCDTGTNYFTGEKAIKMDFISVHRKAQVTQMMSIEQEVIEYIRNDHPGLADLPFMNDEADPISGWSKEYWWRGGPWYATFAVHSADAHDRIIKDSLGVNLALVSNDNAFMGVWGQRTHMARFIQNPREQFNPASEFYMIKKPVLTAMSLLAMLGNERFSDVTMDAAPKQLGMIPTKNENGDIVIALYNSPEFPLDHSIKPSMEMNHNDSLTFEHNDAMVNLNLKGLQSKDPVVVQYGIDEEHGNPYRIWQQLSSPEFPDHDQFLKMWANQDPELMKEQENLKINNGQATIQVAMKPASVSCVVIAQKPELPPSPVTILATRVYKGLSGEPVVFVRWGQTEGGQMLSYDVYFASGDSNDFQKVNPAPVIDQGIAHSWGPGVKSGSYKVQAVDYWSRKSDFSPVVKVSIPQDF